MDDQTREPFEGFQVKESTWDTIEKLTLDKFVERSEIKEIIGDSLVDETIELNKELQSLYEIWKEMNETSDVDALPEPPFLRENLEKQISLLIELLQQKVARHEGELALPAILTEEERDIIKSVSRPNSAFVTRKRSTDLIDESLGNLSLDNSNVLEISLLNERDVVLENDSTPSPVGDISVFQIDKLAGGLRQNIESERKNLLQDISKMQEALLNASSAPTRVSTPTIKDLQHINNKLEKEVTSNDSEVKSKPSIQRRGRPLTVDNRQWSNNFQNQVKVRPSPPTSANVSSYRRPRLVAQLSAAKTVSIQTITLP